MNTEKEDLRFKRKCTTLLRRLGAEDREEYAGSRHLVLETTLGDLHLFPFDGWLATRFQDVPRATAVLNPQREWAGQLNTCSGKWNFHFGDEITVDQAISHIERALSELLPQAGSRAAS